MDFSINGTRIILYLVRDPYLQLYEYARTMICFEM
jgi:hypothetical protein